MTKESNLYNILNTVSTCNSLTEIANKLFMSEPYISRTISDAERDYDTFIIDRKSNPIKLTKAGEVLLKDLRKIMETHNELKYDILPFKKSRDDQLKIAMNQPWLETNTEILIKFLVTTYPEITFSFYERTTNLAQNSLLNHSIDIFIGKYLTNKAIFSKYILPARLYFIIPESCPLFYLNTTELTPNYLKLFDDENYVSLTDNSFFQAMVDNLFNEHEVHLKKTVKVENSLTAIKLAIDGLGYAIGMRDLATKIANNKNKKIKLIHIPENLLQLNIGISRLSKCQNNVAEISNSIEKFITQKPIF